MIKVIGKRVLAKADPPEKSYEGNIEIPEAYKAFNEKFSTKATVLVAGKECEEVKKGDRIIYGWGSYQKINLKDKEYIMLNEDDILGVVDG